jgi:hypothetical protein
VKLVRWSVSTFDVRKLETLGPIEFSHWNSQSFTCEWRHDGTRSRSYLQAGVEILGCKIALFTMTVRVHITI